MSSFLIISVDKSETTPIVLGASTDLTIKIKNLSTDLKLYNLNINITSPDGLSIISSTESITSISPSSNGGNIYSWVNLKDIAPLEIDYTFKVTIKSATVLKDSTTIPFGYIFNNFIVSCQADTMPRGIYDLGNQIITDNATIAFKSVSYNCFISTSSKVLKGAGTLLSLNDYTKTATATCNFTNNSVTKTVINISILLPDGIRYIGNINASGTDSHQLSTPIISVISKGGKTYTQIYFSSITLSLDSDTNFTFTYAVWNRYENNLGPLIYHGTPFDISVTAATKNLNNSTDSITDTKTFLAMDLIITNSINKAITDVFETIFLTYSFYVGGYYDVKDILVNYFIPDGINYLSSSSNPISIVDDINLKGYYLTFNFIFAAKNSSASVTLTGTINDYYRYKNSSNGNFLAVTAFDSFNFADNISGILLQLSSTVTDSSKAYCSINIPYISKTYLNGYYSDGSLKSITPLAPGDLAEFKLTYDSNNLNAIQKSISLDDFFPLSTGPIDNLEFIYTGYTPINLNPALIAPYGIHFNYGNIPSKNLITIKYKVKIKSLSAPYENNNLFKLTGLNTEGYSYSSRTQIPLNIGSPNLNLKKSVSGPSINGIKANEIYKYTITISNSSNLGTETDAFNFTLSDALSTWFTVILDSISISGSGSYIIPFVSNDKIEMNILKLSPGQSLTLTYTVQISSLLAPEVTIKTTATNTNPFSQPNDPLSYNYTNQNKSAFTTIRSKSITISKSTNIDLFKIGSILIYKITLIVPQGTTAYNLLVQDSLPALLQQFLGGSTKNNTPVNPSISNNIITFNTEDIINALDSEQTIIYSFSAKIIEGNKSIGSTSITQTNNCKCIYKQTSSGNNVTINNSLPVNINVPNLILSLSASDNTNNTTFINTGNINTNSILIYKLTFTNNSLITLINGIIEIPIDANLSFSSINNLIFCSAFFNSSTNKIVINISKLDSNAQGFITFTLLPLSTLKTGNFIQTQATAIQYYNAIYNKVYSGESSNLIKLTLAPSLSLLPSPNDKINDSTSFRVSPPGSTVTILNYFQNTGGGHDDFTIKINSVALAYSLYIDDTFITTIPANTEYIADIPQMQNIPSNIRRVIKIITTLPNNIPLGTGYDFIVTTTSKTSPFPSKTVTNIDPNL
ncbi:isopeptide-forming domain-containing fimbrial protein [Clostridium sp.]|uniref:isopeptide-forming domain-containing fimbrial protein n=1 Tax=Clostridium sp. TaxID=1506 RepID=UPI003F2E08EC